LGADTDPHSFDAGLLERRMRHWAAKRGLRVHKSRARDSRAHDWHLWGLEDLTTGEFVNPPIVAGYCCSWTFNQLAAHMLAMVDLSREEAEHADC
jgi:hypothetical protein